MLLLFALWIRIPFDQHTIFEHFIHIVIDTVFGYAYMTTQTSVLTFFVSCCFLIEAGFVHLKGFYEESDEFVAQQFDHTNLKKYKSFIKDVIALHIKLQRYYFEQSFVLFLFLNIYFNLIPAISLRLSEHLSNVMRGPIFFQLICNTIYSAACFMLLEYVCAVQRVTLFFLWL